MKSKSLPDQWSYKTLRKLATINYGRDPSPILDEDGKYPVIGTAYNERLGNGFLYDGESVVLGRKGTIDRVHFISGRFWAIDTAYFLSKFNNALPKWLYYFLTTIDFRSLNEATGVPSLSRDLLYTIKIPTPPKAEQTEIADILSTLDRAIEQTEALIAKQQRIKTGLMQDLLTRGIDENGNLRSEQTHQFQDSPLGRIPVNWRIHQLSDLAQVDRGKFTHRPRNAPRFYGGEYPFIQTGEVTSHTGRSVFSYTQTLSRHGVGVSKRFPSGTVAITIVQTLVIRPYWGFRCFSRTASSEQ